METPFHVSREQPIIWTSAPVYTCIDAQKGSITAAAVHVAPQKGVTTLADDARIGACVAPQKRSIDHTKLEIVFNKAWTWEFAELQSRPRSRASVAPPQMAAPAG